MEAGTGIEPVFTDLQSRSFSPKNNTINLKKYHDKTGTPHERDTGDFLDFLDLIDANAARQVAAQGRIDAVLNCGADAVPFLEIVHSVLAPDQPLPSPYANLMAEAREWAQWASQAERDAYMLANFEASPPDRKAAFLHYVGARAAA